MEILLIPIIGASCLVAVILLLIISLCEHYRNADQIRIRFLKHSYRSIWLEAPGFCEIQHRNYIYSYQQSQLMVAGVNIKRKYSRTSAGHSISGGPEAVEDGHGSGPSSVDYGAAGGDENPFTRRRTAICFSFDDQLPKRNDNEDDEEQQQQEHDPVRRSSSSPAADELSQQQQDADSSALHLLVQKAGADVEATTRARADIADISELYDDTGDSGDESTGLPMKKALSVLEVGRLDSDASSQSRPVQRIHSVLQEFYQSVRAMKLQRAEPSNRRLQSLASTYSERGVPGAVGYCFEIAECDGELEELTRDLVSESDLINSSLRECVQHGSNRTSRDYPISLHSPEHHDLSPLSPTSPGSSSGVTLGHASGLRRFLFSSGRRPRTGEQTGGGATRLAPRLSSSQSSV